MLSEDVRRVEEVQEVDDRLDGEGRGNERVPEVVQVMLDRRKVGVERMAGDVNELCDRSGAPTGEKRWWSASAMARMEVITHVELLALEQV